MIYFLKAIRRMLIKYSFKKKWRSLNNHNQTHAINIFDQNIVKVGKMSYGPLEVHGWKASNESLVIGNYVSIASGVKFILGGNHYYNVFSTYPFKVMLGIEENEAYSNGPINIEDDVWIGTDSLILSGVTIGKGAVIAARSVVIKNILPYSVVGGNPAKVIKMRFDDSIIDKLLALDSNFLNHNQIRDNIDMFYKPLDVDTMSNIVVLLNKRNIE